MASARLSGRSWVASFLPLLERKRRRTVRIPVSQIPAVDTKANRTAANAFAGECDRYCRLLEVDPKPDQVEHAHRIGAITDAQRDALLQHLSPPQAQTVDPESPAEISILAAAKRHPSTRREDLASARRHEKAVLAFCEWAKIHRLCDLHLGHITDWVEHLRGQGWAFDSRRHALVWLRCATAVAPSLGLPDVIGRMRIDRREAGERIKVEAYTLREIGRALLRFDPARCAHAEGRVPKGLPAVDRRARVAIALGAFVGLRPSETQEATCGSINVRLAAIHTGRKTEASERDLALPPTIARWCAELIGDRPSEAPLIPSYSARAKGRAMDETTWSQWLGPLLREATGRTLSTKHLRKTFATHTSRALPGHVVEAYLGHADPRVTPVTSQHYRAREAIEGLRPHALSIERLLLRCLHRAWAEKRGRGWSIVDMRRRQKLQRIALSYNLSGS